MDAPVLIGDEWTAVGYRLAGARIVTPSPAATAAEFERACASGAPLVLMTAGAARHLPAGTIERAQAACAPLVLVVTDAAGCEPPADLAAVLRRRLGVGA